MRIPAAAVSPARGHAHFWERAAAASVTRGQFLARTAGTVGALAGFGLLAPTGALAKKSSSSPKPIPFGLRPADLGLPVPPFPEIIHVLAPGVLTDPKSDPITITDFDGHIGYSIIDGAGTGTTAAGTKRYTTNTDMRFMQGAYVGEDGRVRHGTFGFI
jgi:hypothetical protein